MVVAPNWFGTGVIATVRLDPLPPSTMLAVGTSVVFDELPATVREAAGVSTSPTVTLKTGSAVSSFVVLSAVSEIVGVSLATFTVSTKLSAAVAPLPSVTVKVIVDAPD